MILGYYGKNNFVEAKGYKFIIPRFYPSWSVRSEKNKTELGIAVENNVNTLYEVIKWNIENDIYYYRFVFEYINDYYNWVPITELPNFNKIETVLKKIGKYILDNNFRLSTHPALFNVLSSDKEKVVKNTIKNLNAHSIFFDLMGLPANDFYPINIHVGGATGSKSDALRRFIESFDKLYDTTKKRLVVENDDKPSLFSVKELIYLHENIGIPICFDYLHHSFYDGGLTEEEGLKLASSTWKTFPVVHITSTILNENQTAKNPRKHADFLHESFDDHGINLYAMIEAKESLKSLLKYRGYGNKS